jgi:DNA-directed RNA polymerase subunit beta'
MHIPYGAILNVKDGQKVAKGDAICTWDPFNNVIVAESNGKIKFESVIEGITYRDEADEQTGHREKVVIETKDKTKLPTIYVEGKDKKAYNLPVGSHIVIEEGEEFDPRKLKTKYWDIQGTSLTNRLVYDDVELDDEGMDSEHDNWRGQWSEFSVHETE